MESIKGVEFVALTKDEIDAMIAKAALAGASVAAETMEKAHRKERKEIKDRLLDVIANQYYRDYSSDRRKVDMVTKECVREIIYKDKERIIDRIVSQASSHTKTLTVLMKF